MRTLLIEDDISMTRSIELMLKSEDYIVDEADLGEDRLKIGKT
jgi:two-component system cell cycle response regulator CtrA